MAARSARALSRVAAAGRCGFRIVMTVGELCRTGPVGAGVLLGRKGVALSRPTAL